MPIDDETYCFAAPVALDDGVDPGYMKHFIPLTDDAVESLGLKSGDRVVGDLNGQKFKRAVQRTSDALLCLKFGAGWLASADLSPGDVVTVTLSRDANPDHVEVPEPLASMLEEDAELNAAWHRLTPGKRRTLVYPVERAKREDTKQRRAQAALDTLRNTLTD